MSFTAVFQKVPQGYIGFVEELPGANTQGDTLEEARENLREAVMMVMEALCRLPDYADFGGQACGFPATD
jgi:predicted RNase H-like HicB family nuclease